MDFGSTIKAAREAKGLSLSQVAAQTHILVQIVERMERNDFGMIPAPIYGRGFVRLISECLGLDAASMTAEYMRASKAGASAAALPPASERPAPAPVVSAPIAAEPPRVEPAATPAPAPEPEPIAPAPAPASASEPARETPPDLVGLELFDPDTEPRISQPLPEEEGVSDFSRFAALLPEEDERVSPAERFRAGLSAVSGGVLHTFRGVRKPLLRLAALALAGIAVLSLLVWGIVALFRATSDSHAVPAPVSESSPAAPAPAVTTNDVGKTPAAELKLRPFYLP